MENHNSKLEIHNNEMATAIHKHKMAALAAMPQQLRTEATEQTQPTSAKEQHKAASGVGMDEVAARSESLIESTNTNFFDLDNDFYRGASQSCAPEHEHHPTIRGEFSPSFLLLGSKNQVATIKPANSSSATPLSTTPRLPVPKCSEQDPKKQYERLTENHIHPDCIEEGVKKPIQLYTSVYSGNPQYIRNSAEQGLKKWRKGCWYYTEERAGHRNAAKDHKDLASASAASMGVAFDLPKATEQQDNLTERDRKKPKDPCLRLEASREKRLPGPTGLPSMFAPPGLPTYTKQQAPLIERNQQRLLDARFRIEPVNRPVNGGEKSLNLPQFSSKYTEYYYMNQQEEIKGQMSQRYPPRLNLGVGNDAKFIEHLEYQDEKSSRGLSKHNYVPQMKPTKERVLPDLVSTAATTDMESSSNRHVRPELSDQELREKRERNDQACKEWYGKVMDPSEGYHAIPTSVSAARLSLYPHSLSRLPQLTEPEIKESRERISNLKDRHAEENYYLKSTLTSAPRLPPFQVPKVPTYFDRGKQQLQEQNQKRLIAAQESHPSQHSASTSNIQGPKNTKQELGQQKEKAKKPHTPTPFLEYYYAELEALKLQRARRIQMDAAGQNNHPASALASNARESGPSNVQAPKTVKQESGQEKGNKPQTSTPSVQDYHAQIEAHKQKNARKQQMEAAGKNNHSESALAPASTLNAGKNDPSNVPSVPKNTKQEPVKQKEKGRMPGQVPYTHFADYCAQLEAKKENPENGPTYNTTTTTSKPSISSPQTQVQSQSQSQQNPHHLSPTHTPNFPQETCGSTSPSSYNNTNTKPPTHRCEGYLDKKSNEGCCIGLTCAYTPYPCPFAKQLGCNMRWATGIAAKMHGMIRHPIHHEPARIKVTEAVKDTRDTKAGKFDDENGNGGDDKVVEEPISQCTRAELKLGGREKSIECVRAAEGEYDRQKQNAGPACKLSGEERVNAAQRVVEQHKGFTNQIVKERDELLAPAQREEKRQKKLWKECQDGIAESRKDHEKFQTFKRREQEFVKIGQEMHENHWIRKVGELSIQQAAELKKIRDQYAREGKEDDELIKAHIERLVAYTGNEKLQFIIPKQNEAQAKALEEAGEKLNKKQKLDAPQQKGKGREFGLIIKSELRSATPEHNGLWMAPKAVKERQKQEGMEESKDKKNDEGVNGAEEKEKEKAFLKEQQQYAEQADQFSQSYKQWETAKDKRPERSRTKDLDVPADSKLDIVLSGYSVDEEEITSQPGPVSRKSSTT